jgi:hypothetical protein
MKSKNNGATAIAFVIVLAPNKILIHRDEREKNQNESI